MTDPATRSMKLSSELCRRDALSVFEIIVEVEDAEFAREVERVVAMRCMGAVAWKASSPSPYCRLREPSCPGTRKLQTTKLPSPLSRSKAVLKSALFML